MIDKKPNTIHILGNGPSLSLFNRDAWPEDDLFVGCNYSDVNLRPDFTVIVDAKPILKLFEGKSLNIPAVISSRCLDYVDYDKSKSKSSWKKLPKDAISILDSIDIIHESGQPFPMNSGQHAVMYCLNKYSDTIKTVYLWGIDSLWTDDISSFSDYHFKGSINNIQKREKPRVAKTWRSYWDKIFDENKNVKFIIKGKDENII